MLARTMKNISSDSRSPVESFGARTLGTPPPLYLRRVSWHRIGDGRFVADQTRDLACTIFRAEPTAGNWPIWREIKKKREKSLLDHVLTIYRGRIAKGAKRTKPRLERERERRKMRMRSTRINGGKACEMFQIAGIRDFSRRAILGERGVSLLTFLRSPRGREPRDRVHRRHASSARPFRFSFLRSIGRARGGVRREREIESLRRCHYGNLIVI